MMKENKFENKLVNRLFDIAITDNLEQNLETINNELKEDFLAFGSETPDNVDCMNHIEYGLVKDRFLPERFGLRIKGKNIPLSEITNWNETMPDVIKREFPDLTSEEWLACMRMVSMILISLERNKI